MSGRSPLTLPATRGHAHALCQYLVEKALGRNTRDPTGDLTWYDGEMQEAAEAYTAFVMEQVAQAKELCPDPLVCVEQTLHGANGLCREPKYETV